MTFRGLGSSSSRDWQFSGSYRASTDARVVNLKVADVVFANIGCVVYSINICDIAKESILEALNSGADDETINNFLNSELQKQINAYLGKGKNTFALHMVRPRWLISIIACMVDEISFDLHDRRFDFGCTIMRCGKTITLPSLAQRVSKTGQLMGWSLVPMAVWVLCRLAWFTWTYFQVRKNRVLSAKKQLKLVENLEMNQIYRQRIQSDY